MCVEIRISIIWTDAGVNVEAMARLDETHCQSWESSKGRVGFRWKIDHCRAVLRDMLLRGAAEIVARLRDGLAEYLEAAMADMNELEILDLAMHVMTGRRVTQLGISHAWLLVDPDAGCCTEGLGVLLAVHLELNHPVATVVVHAILVAIHNSGNLECG